MLETKQFPILSCFFRVDERTEMSIQHCCTPVALFNYRMAYAGAGAGPVLGGGGGLHPGPGGGHPTGLRHPPTSGKAFLHSTTGKSSQNHTYRESSTRFSALVFIWFESRWTSKSYLNFCSIRFQISGEIRKRSWTCLRQRRFSF